MLQPIHLRIISHVFTLAVQIGHSIVCQSSKQKDAPLDFEVAKMETMMVCYFTVWNIVFQVVYASVGLYCDVMELTKTWDQKKIASHMEYRKLFFSAILCPCSLYVFTTFWPIYFIDRRLIFPESVENSLTRFTNIISHAAIIPPLVSEMIFLPISPPKSHKKYLIVLNCLIFIYYGQVLRTYIATNMWPYPMLTRIGNSNMPFFAIASYTVFYLNYKLQWVLVRWFQNTERNKVQ